MFKHYFKIILRDIIRNRLYSFINLIGLSSGISASLILLLFIQHEFSFDQFHEKKNQIYRIISLNEKSGTRYARAPYKLAPLLESNLPEVQKTCRVREMGYLVKKGDEYIHEKNFIQVDSSFFDIFSFSLIQGDANNALVKNNSVLITESMAEKYFPNENPLGKWLEIIHSEKVYLQQITAVIKDFPSNSHIQADFILPIYTAIWGFENINRQKVVPSFEDWSWNYFLTYVLLPEDINKDLLIQKIPSLIRANVKGDFSTIFELQALKKIHLFSDLLNSDMANKGNLKHIYLFGMIALLILSIAIINYIILSTARSLKKTKEIGLRKVLGANRTKIMKQVLGESVFMSFLSLPVAIILTNLFLPYINNHLGKSIILNIYSNPLILLTLFIICLLAGLISGSYIALYLSSFKPIDVFRSQINLGLRGSIFQKSLIVIQLIIFIGLIICSGIIYNQVRFMKNNDTLGFNKENLISVVTLKNSFSKKYSSLKAELLKNPNIQFVSCAMIESPAFNTDIANFGITDSETNKQSKIRFELNQVDYDYIRTMGMKIIEGRPFNKTDKSGWTTSIVNEQFIKAFDVKNPLTEKFKFTNFKMDIVGIIKDYHTNSLTEKIEPVMLLNGSNYIRQMIIKTNEKYTSETLAFIERKWKEFNPNTPFEYSFTETYIENLYKSEMNLARIIGSFAALAILIASLGLFGLSLFIAQKKTREIVIRKTMGASVSNIIIRLLKQFFGITIIANILAMPITWFYMDKWLQNFEYQSMMDYRIFVVAGLSSLILCLLTVSYHSAKAAIINPVRALKYE